MPNFLITIKFPFFIYCGCIL